MERIMTPELLAPAGSPEKLEYALAYGADAVYAGIPKFSLRARENPFKDATLKEAIVRTQKLGRKFYLTANILPPNRKIESFQKSLAYFAEAGPDAIIMADPSNAKRRCRPGARSPDSSAASMANVPEPHIGSRKDPARSHPESRSSPAAIDSLSGLFTWIGR